MKAWNGHLPSFVSNSAGRNIMSSKAIVQLLFLTIIVLFISGFAKIDDIEERVERQSGRIGSTARNPASSCHAIVNAARGRQLRNGQYFIRTRNGVRKMYCNLVNQRCGVRGWMRVASVDASSGRCPNNYRLTFAGRGIRVCRGDVRAPISGRSRVHRATFHVRGLSFTQVAAFVEGHQFGSPDAFNRRNTRGGLDGITFSYGNSRTQHLLWVYAAGVADKKDRADCPCSTVSGDAAPSRYGRFHYCDTGNSGRTSQNRWFTEKVLWSGKGCPATSNCCNAPNLPYFCRSHLQNSRNTDRFVVSTRLNDPASIEDIGITKLEIYVA